MLKKWVNKESMDKYKKRVDTITSQKNSNYTITISNVDNIENISIRCYHVENHWYKNFNQPYEIDTEPQPSIEGEEAIQLKNNTAYFNFELKKGITYTFCINSNDDNISNYNIQISQNNWVYAPNGGMISHTFNTNTFGILDSKVEQFYIPDNIIYSIIEEYHKSKEEPSENTLDEHLKNITSEEGLYNLCYIDSQIVLDSINNGYSDYMDILATGGNISTIVGLDTTIIALFTQQSTNSIIVVINNIAGGISTIATFVGGACLNISYLENKFIHDEMTTALKNGRYNIVITHTISNEINKNDYCTFVVPSTSETYEGWNIHKYINKYSIVKEKQAIYLYEEMLG